VLNSASPGAAPKMKGLKCGECGNYALIRRDGCDFCKRLRLGGVVRLGSPGRFHETHALLRPDRLLARSASHRLKGLRQKTDKP